MCCCGSAVCRGVLWCGELTAGALRIALICGLLRGGRAGRGLARRRGARRKVAPSGVLQPARDAVAADPFDGQFLSGRGAAHGSLGRAGNRSPAVLCVRSVPVCA